jgi:hypothetical protein
MVNLRRQFIFQILLLHCWERRKTNSVRRAPSSVIFQGTEKKEIIVADYDGDLIAYRQSVPNSLEFTVAWIDSSELFEMSDYLTAGDYNGDGTLDFAVAGHTDLSLNQDREYTVPVWTVRVFSHLAGTPSGSITKIWEQHLLGVRSGSGYDNGLVSGKLKNNDPADALFVSVNPHLYVFEWDGVRRTFVPRWHHASASNSVIIDDLDGDTYNDIGIHVDSRTEFWSLEQATVVPTPFAFTARPLSSSVIRLTWNSSISSHRIYRGSHPDSLVMLRTVNGTVWNDSSLTENKRYYYAVAAINGQESGLSDRADAIPHVSPFITSAVQSSIDQVVLNLSYDITPSSLFSARIILDPLSARIQSSTLVWRSARSFVVTFPVPLELGQHSVKIEQLHDESGMDADTGKHFSFTAASAAESIFIVSSISMQSPRRILIEFNMPPDLLTAKNIANYSVRTIARSFPIASVDSVSPASIALNFASGNSLNSLALRIETSLDRNIRSSGGAALNSGKGQVLSIAQEATDLEQCTVFPNPVKNSSAVTFVNLPKNCRITVFSPNGERIRTLSELTGREGTAWDLKDERGNIVSTGIYLYRVEQLGTSNDVLRTKLGKFAVLR